jgi:ubiquinone/menaquinone biosynthesis C-methylase UbiE
MESRNTQEQVFLNGEADNWFKRNESMLGESQSAIDVEVVSQFLQPFKQSIEKILEIGCSNGKKLQGICSAIDASGYGIDPSQTAIEDGKSRFAGKDINLAVGTASKLEFPDSYFDVVYFGFSLYLLDRSSLFQSIAEADRVLRDGGYLVIHDFDPGFRTKRSYVHREGVSSYKNSYSDFFVSSGHYYLVSKSSFSHSSTSFNPDPNERISISLLYKETEAYPELVI